MRRISCTMGMSLLVCGTSHASNCEAIRAQIDARIRAAGVQVFMLQTVDIGSNAPGRVVGHCGQGSKKILYLAGPASAAAVSPPSAARPPARQGEALLTECKDGTMSVGGDCRK